MVEGKILQSETIYDILCLITYFRSLRINGAQFQIQTVNDNTSSRTKWIEIKFWIVER